MRRDKGRVGGEIFARICVPDVVRFIKMMAIVFRIRERDAMVS